MQKQQVLLAGNSSLQLQYRLYFRLQTGEREREKEQEKGVCVWMNMDNTHSRLGKTFKRVATLLFRGFECD